MNLCTFMIMNKNCKFLSKHLFKYILFTHTCLSHFLCKSLFTLISFIHFKSPHIHLIYLSSSPSSTLISFVYTYILHLHSFSLMTLFISFFHMVIFFLYFVLFLLKMNASYEKLFCQLMSLAIVD